MIAGNDHPKVVTAWLVRQDQRRAAFVGKPAVAPLEQSQQYGIKVATPFRSADIRRGRRAPNREWSAICPAGSAVRGGRSGYWSPSTCRAECHRSGLMRVNIARTTSVAHRSPNNSIIVSTSGRPPGRRAVTRAVEAPAFIVRNDLGQPRPFAPVDVARVDFLPGNGRRSESARFPRRTRCAAGEPESRGSRLPSDAASAASSRRWETGRAPSGSTHNRNRALPSSAVWQGNPRRPACVAAR